MNKYGTCLEQLMRKFDPLKQLWYLLAVGVSHFVHGVKPPDKYSPDAKYKCSHVDCIQLHQTAKSLTSRAARLVSDFAI